MSVLDRKLVEQCVKVFLNGFLYLLVRHPSRRLPQLLSTIEGLQSRLEGSRTVAVPCEAT